MKVSVSFLKSRYSLAETIAKIENSPADYLHVDVMDGFFVPEKNLEIAEFVTLLNHSSKPLDLHLMMNEENALEAIKSFKTLNPKIITVPVELTNVEQLIYKIKKENIKVGVSINPDTNLTSVLPYLSLIDMILVMSVYPGKGGQTFLPQTILKLQELKKILEDHNKTITISVDGGINEKNIKEIITNCNIVVSGSFVCMAENYSIQINKLKDI